MQERPKAPKQGTARGPLGIEIASLDAAKKYLAGLGECSVLFENDLPDNYV